MIELKTRILSSLVGLIILAVVIIFLDTLLFNAVVGVIALVAVWELMHAVGLNKHRSLLILTMLLAALIPFAQARGVRAILPEVIFALVVLFFLVLLRKHREISIADIAMAFFFGLVIPVFFSCAVSLRDDFGVVIGCFYLLCALGAAWLGDTCAYFTGLRFGKHKLVPVISPKKTVEGFIGGIVGGTVLMLMLGLIFSLVVRLLGSPVDIAYGKLLLITPVVILVGVLGDLSASVIKRGCGIKDYGNIMPGHGGVLDRFDSALFTLPCIYLLSRHLEWIALIG